MNLSDAPVGHVVGEGGKCWCGTHHTLAHPPDTVAQDMDDTVAQLAGELSHRMVKTLNDLLRDVARDRPHQREFFTMPPRGYWVYKVEYRIWLKWTDGREYWSEWTSAEKRGVCRRWYSRRADAEKAMERRKRGLFWTDREFRVAEQWSEFKPKD